jgi:hypothetical protein
LGTVKWLNVRNGYGFINGKVTRKMCCTRLPARKPQKGPRREGMETEEFDIGEEKKGVEVSKFTGAGGALVQAVNMQQTRTSIDIVHILGSSAVTYRITKMVRQGKRTIGE